MQADEGLRLLTDDERRNVETKGQLPAIGFVDQFERWAARKTDAPPYTLRAAGLMALSLAAGDGVVLDGLFSSKPIHMNLYVLIVGPSTVLRKSTVLGYINDLMPHTVAGGKLVTTLDDVSPQALNRALAGAGANRTPVLMNLDEVAGIFEVQKRSNSYLKGFDKILMKAYDHSAIHVLRAQTTIDVPDGAFVSILSASTPDPLEAVLESEDVESGLLPRFLIFDAREAQRGKRRSLMARQADETWEQDREDLVKHVAQLAAPTISKQPNPIVIRFSQDALKRLDALDAIIYREAADQSTALGAMKGRAFWHVVKVAGLYAVSRDGRKATVELHDVLRAMHLVEDAVQDLANMAQDVANNSFERQAQEVLDYLETAGGSADQAIITDALKLEWREAADLVRTLGMRGKMIVDDKTKEWRLT